MCSHVSLAHNNKTNKCNNAAAFSTMLLNRAISPFFTRFSRAIPSNYQLRKTIEILELRFRLYITTISLQLHIHHALLDLLQVLQRSTYGGFFPELLLYRLWPKSVSPQRLRRLYLRRSLTHSNITTTGRQRRPLIIPTCPERKPARVTA